MAETEGPQNEGTENSAEASTESTAYLSTMHITSYEEMKADNLAYTGQGYTGWAEAVSKDERAQKHQREQSPRSRSQASLRATYRAATDWQRTVRGVQRQMAAQLQPSSPSEPYGKGGREVFWGKVTMGIFRLLGLD
jgi:hypothetical protein